jgi:thiol-disulfide isomerase/thioredoxin
MKPALLLPLGLALMSGTALLGADRLVVVEDFNATWCGPCIPVGQALNDLQDDYAGDVIVFQVHQADAYATTWGNQRAAFYGVPGYPTVWFDGIDSRVGTAGSAAVDYAAFVQMLSGRLGDATDVFVDTVAAPLGGNQYRVDAFVGIEPGGTGKTMRLHIVQALDNTPSGSHYLNCFMQANDYETITLAPGEWTVVSHTFTLTGESASRLQDVRFIAFAQTNSGSGPAEIHNADWVGTQPMHVWACCIDGDCVATTQAFCNAISGEWQPGTGCGESACVTGCAGDANGDGDVGLTDLLSVLSAWGPCEGCEADFDGDDLVSFSDLLLVIGLWGPCP